MIENGAPRPRGVSGDSALRQFCAWKAEGIHLDVAVNITARDLLDLRFADEVAGVLDRWRVPPEELELIGHAKETRERPGSQPLHEPD